MRHVSGLLVGMFWYKCFSRRQAAVTAMKANTLIANIQWKRILPPPKEEALNFMLSYCCLSLFVNCIKLWPIPPHEVLEAWPLATVVGICLEPRQIHIPQFCMHESSRRRLHHGGDHGKQHRNQAQHNLGSSCLLQEWNRDHHIHRSHLFHPALRHSRQSSLKPNTCRFWWKITNLLTYGWLMTSPSSSLLCLLSPCASWCLVQT